MTQQQLGTAVGVSAQMVSNWETNFRGMTARNLQAVARALGVSMDDIVLPEPREERAI